MIGDAATLHHCRTLAQTKASRRALNPRLALDPVQALFNRLLVAFHPVTDNDVFKGVTAKAARCTI
jgi:hypothetical protein